MATRYGLIKQQNGVCVYCLQRFVDLDETVDIDHIYPRSRAGSNRRRNRVAACHRCNVIKGNRVFRSWQEIHDYIAVYNLRHSKQPTDAIHNSIVRRKSDKLSLDEIRCLQRDVKDFVYTTSLDLSRVVRVPTIKPRSTIPDVKPIDRSMWRTVYGPMVRIDSKKIPTITLPLATAEIVQEQRRKKNLEWCTMILDELILGTAAYSKSDT